MREKRERITRPEDLGEPAPELGTNATSVGAGARAEEEAMPETSDYHLRHPRVKSGAEESDLPMEAPKYPERPPKKR